MNFVFSFTFIKYHDRENSFMLPNPRTIGELMPAFIRKLFLFSVVTKYIHVDARAQCFKDEEKIIAHVMKKIFLVCSKCCENEKRRTSTDFSTWFGMQPRGENSNIVAKHMQKIGILGQHCPLPKRRGKMKVESNLNQFGWNKKRRRSFMTPLKNRSDVFFVPWKCCVPA